MLALKLVKHFGKIKSLKCTGLATDKGMKLSSQTQDHSFEIHNPLQTLIGALAACEISTLRGLNSHDKKLKIKKIEFKKIESSYQLEKFMKGGKDNAIDEVNIEAEI